MQLPFFYTQQTGAPGTSLVLDETNSKHVIQVLRRQAGDRIRLTNGEGNLYTAVITDDHRKHCTVLVEEVEHINRQGPLVTLALSPLKNSSRYEWFLEKATELGVAAILPLLCARTEKQQLRTDRLQGILVSAMLQSQQCWLPVLAPAVKMEKINWNDYAGYDRFVAHCLPGKPKELLAAVLPSSGPERLILIGPEGDLTPEEVELAEQAGCRPVSLGDNRLRTETAGIVAATLARLV